MKHRTGDEGASLLIVLVFMLLVSVIATGLLGFAQASFEGSDSVRENRRDTYAVDAATEFAVRQVTDEATGDMGTSYGPACAYTLVGVNGRSVTTTCRAAAGSGTYAANKPINALLTLSTTSPLKLTGNHALLVDGRVYSNQGIVTDNPFSTLDSTATITAEGNGDCTSNKVTAAKGKFCSAVSTPAGNDPAWPSALVTRPTLVTAVTYDCTLGKGGDKKSHERITFPEGTYTGGSWATFMAAASVAGCDDDALLYFKPGVHYLENLELSLESHSLVAGTPAGSWFASKTDPPSDGSACNNLAPGTQFILGGSSSLKAVGTKDPAPTITLCAGPTPADAPAIALHGLRSAVGTMKALASAVALETSNKPSVFIHGTIYLPTSQARVTLHNRARTNFSRGIVVDSLIADISASSKLTGAAISLPACSEADPCRTDRRVIFTATAPGGGATLSSVVQFDDDRGGLPSKSSALVQWSRVE